MLKSVSIPGRIIALFLLLLIGIIALSCVITFKEHYETTGAFIDLLRLITTQFSLLVFAALLIMAFFIHKLGTPTKAP